MASDEELERTRHMVQRQPGSADSDGTAAQESTLPLRTGAAMPALPLREAAATERDDAEITMFSPPPVHVPESVPARPAPPLVAAALASTRAPARGFSPWYAVSLGIIALGLILYAAARFLPG